MANMMAKRGVAACSARSSLLRRGSHWHIDPVHAYGGRVFITSALSYRTVVISTVPVISEVVVAMRPPP
jgi:hypothetical protein